MLRSVPGLIHGLCGVLLVSQPAAVVAQQRAIPGLQCRVASGPWRPCQMDLDADGLGWELQVGRETVRFRSDGRGAVSMQRGRHNWRSVTARWQPDSSLCWDGVCALGPFPLD